MLDFFPDVTSPSPRRNNSCKLSDLGRNLDMQFQEAKNHMIVTIDAEKAFD